MGKVSIGDGCPNYFLQLRDPICLQNLVLIVVASAGTAPPSPSLSHNFPPNSTSLPGRCITGNSDASGFFPPLPLSLSTHAHPSFQLKAVTMQFRGTQHAGSVCMGGTLSSIFDAHFIWHTARGRSFCGKGGWTPTLSLSASSYSSQRGDRATVL